MTLGLPHEYNILIIQQLQVWARSSSQLPSCPKQLTSSLRTISGPNDFAIKRVEKDGTTCGIMWNQWQELLKLSYVPSRQELLQFVFKLFKPNRKRDMDLNPSWDTMGSFASMWMSEHGCRKSLPKFYGLLSQLDNHKKTSFFETNSYILWQVKSQTPFFGIMFNICRKENGANDLSW